MSEKNKKILIVEDETDMVSALKIRFEATGYTVVVASNGQEGLSKARREKPDLVILDVMLPKMDGLTVCRMLKFDERFQKTPILMLTAKMQKKDVQQGKEMGADAYMTKPFKSEELLSTVEGLLKDKP